MTTEIFRYTFEPSVSIDEVEATALLALVATEGLHGETMTRLETSHTIDRDQRTCVIDARKPAGRDFNRIFLGFIQREFHSAAFDVERVAFVSSDASASLTQ